MPGKSSAHENTILQLVFNGTINAKLAGRIDRVWRFCRERSPMGADRAGEDRIMNNLFKLAATL